jgi:DNA-binding response OmpR family regulator
MARKHILVVDDDPAVRNMIMDYLSTHDFYVSAVSDGEEMARIIANRIVDLIILDLRLAKDDGLGLLRELRCHSDVPIIILTGQRLDEVDRIVGLELGADDYVTKPFSARELLARIRAVLRRISARKTTPSKGDMLTRYRFAGWEINLRTRRLISPAGQFTPLTKGEFGLLTAFLRSPQQVLSRDQLLTFSRLHSDEVYERSIDVQILRLRRKLEVNSAEPQLIKTERGIGYVFTAMVEAF